MDRSLMFVIVFLLVLALIYNRMYMNAGLSAAAMNTDVAKADAARAATKAADASATAREADASAFTAALNANTATAAAKAATAAAAAAKAAADENALDDAMATVAAEANASAVLANKAQADAELIAALAASEALAATTAANLAVAALAEKEAAVKYVTDNAAADKATADAEKASTAAENSRLASVAKAKADADAAAALKVVTDNAAAAKSTADAEKAATAAENARLARVANDTADANMAAALKVASDNAAATKATVDAERAATAAENARLARVAKATADANTASALKVATDNAAAAKAITDAAAEALAAQNKAAGVRVSSAGECVSSRAALWSDYGEPGNFGIRCCRGPNVVVVGGVMWCADLQIGDDCNSNNQCSSGNCGTYNTCVAAAANTANTAATTAATAITADANTITCRRIRINFKGDLRTAEIKITAYDQAGNPISGGVATEDNLKSIYTQVVFPQDTIVSRIVITNRVGTFADRINGSTLVVTKSDNEVVLTSALLDGAYATYIFEAPFVSGLTATTYKYTTIPSVTTASMAVGAAVSAAGECTTSQAARWTTYAGETGMRCCPGSNVVTVNGLMFCADLPLEAKCDSDLQCASGMKCINNNCVVTPDPSGYYNTTYWNNAPTQFTSMGTIVYNPTTGTGTINNTVGFGTISRVSGASNGNRFAWGSLLGTFDGTAMRWDNNSTWTGITAIPAAAVATETTSSDPSGQYASTYMNSSPTTFLSPGIIVYNPVTGSGTIDNGVSAGTLSRVMTEATGTRFMWVELSLRGTFDGTMMRWDNNSTWTARTAIPVPPGQYTIKGGQYGKFCADDAKMVCNRDTAGKWETFTIIQNGNGYNIRGGRDNKFCADEGNRIVCNRGTAGQWETFKINKKGDVYNLIGGKNNKLCADENGNIVCNRDAEGTWEQFKLIKL